MFFLDTCVLHGVCNQTLCQWVEGRMYHHICWGHIDKNKVPMGMPGGVPTRIFSQSARNLQNPFIGKSVIRSAQNNPNLGHRWVKIRVQRSFSILPWRVFLCFLACEPLTQEQWKEQDKTSVHKMNNTNINHKPKA